MTREEIASAVRAEFCRDHKSAGACKIGERVEQAALTVLGRLDRADLIDLLNNWLRQEILRFDGSDR